MSAWMGGWVCMCVGVRVCADVCVRSVLPKHSQNALLQSAG